MDFDHLGPATAREQLSVLLAKLEEPRVHLSMLKITDREVDELFKCVDTGDGLISGEEFRLFLAAKKDMKKKAMSGALGRKKGDSVEGDGATSPSAKVGSPRQTDAEIAAER